MAKIRYVKDGFFMDGVPTRDLTEDEWYAIPEDTRTALLDQGIYQLERAKPAAPKKAEEEVSNA